MEPVVKQILTVAEEDKELIMRTARALCKYRQQHRYEDHWTNSATACTNCVIDTAVEFGKKQPDLQI